MISFVEVDTGGQGASTYQSTGARLSRCVGPSNVGEAMARLARKTNEKTKDAKRRMIDGGKVSVGMT